MAPRGRGDRARGDGRPARIAHRLAPASALDLRAEQPARGGLVEGLPAAAQRPKRGTKEAGGVWSQGGGGKRGGAG